MKRELYKKKQPRAQWSFYINLGGKTMDRVIVLVVMVILGWLVGPYILSAGISLIYPSTQKALLQRDDNIDVSIADGSNRCRMLYEAKDISAVKSVVEMARLRNVEVSDSTGKGSGVRYRANYILTVGHLMKRGPFLINGITAESAIVSGRSEDIGLLECKGCPSVPGLEIYDGALQKCQQVIVVGNPVGNAGQVMLTYITNPVANEFIETFEIRGMTTFGNSGGGVYDLKTLKLIGVLASVDFGSGTNYATRASPFLSRARIKYPNL